MNNEKNKRIDFIGIGAQKSATTWVFKCLQEHPEICMPSEKEVHFFDSEEKFNKGLDWYLTKFNSCSGEQIKGELTTLYLSSDKAPERIKKLFPKVKLLVFLRNPIERAFSHIRHLQSKGELPDKISVQQAVNLFPEIIENGLYGKHLKRYLDFFSRKQILLMFFDKIEKTPKESIRQVFLFLDVDDFFIPKNILNRYNTSEFRTSSFHTLTNKTYFFMNSSILGRLAIKALKLFGVTSAKLNMFFGKNKKKKGSLGKQRLATDKRFLYGFFKKDIVLLESEFSISLDRWRQI